MFRSSTYANEPFFFPLGLRFTLRSKPGLDDVLFVTFMQVASLPLVACACEFVLICIVCAASHTGRSRILYIMKQFQTFGSCTSQNPQGSDTDCAGVHIPARCTRQLPCKHVAPKMSCLHVHACIHRSYMQCLCAWSLFRATFTHGPICYLCHDVACI